MPWSLVSGERKRFSAAAHHRTGQRRAGCPRFTPRRTYAEQGGLISYGPDNSEITRRAAAAIARILSGTNPGDIPIYQPTRFEFRHQPENRQGARHHRAGTASRTCRRDD